MKTIKLFIVVVFAVFTNSATAQVTSISLSYGDKFMAFSPNSEYQMIAYNDPSDNAEVYVYQTQTDGTSDLVDYYVLPKGDTGNVGVTIFPSFMAVSNTGNSYIDFHDTWINSNRHTVFMKNGIVMSGITPGLPRVIDGYVYVSDGNMLTKIDEITDVVQWTVSAPFSMEMNVLNGDVYLTDRSTGDLVRFDGATGANLGVVKNGEHGDSYKFSDNGDLSMNNYWGANLMSIYDANDYNQLIAVTDLPDGLNLFGKGQLDWKISAGKYTGLGSTHVVYLSDNLKHGSKIPLADISVYGDIKNAYLGDDFIKYMTLDDFNTVHIITMDLPTEDPAHIPTVNTSHADIVAGFDESIYDDVNNVVLDGYYYQILMVFDDNAMPVVDDMPDENWYIVPNGYEYAGSFPIRNVNGKLIFDSSFLETVTGYQHEILIRTEARSESSTVLATHSSTLTDELLIYPNPATDRVTVTYSQGIEAIEIVNVLGQTVFNKKYQGFDENQTLDINNLDAGTYFVRIRDAINHVYTEKLLVE